MRQSRTFIPTTREVPSSAEAISHKLLIKAGMVKQVSAGVYTYLPLATKVIQNIEKVIRDEHAKIGAYANFTIRRLLETIRTLVQNGR